MTDWSTYVRPQLAPTVTPPRRLKSTTARERRDRVALLLQRCIGAADYQALRCGAESLLAIADCQTVCDLIDALSERGVVTVEGVEHELRRLTWRMRRNL